MAKILPVFLPFASCGNKCIFCDQQAISGVKAENNVSVKGTSEDEVKKAFRDYIDELTSKDSKKI